MQFWFVYNDFGFHTIYKNFKQKYEVHFEFILIFFRFSFLLMIFLIGSWWGWFFLPSLFTFLIVQSFHSIAFTRQSNSNESGDVPVGQKSPTKEVLVSAWIRLWLPLGGEVSFRRKFQDHPRPKLGGWPFLVSKRRSPWDGGRQGTLVQP